MKYVGDSSYAIQSPKFPVERWLKIMKRIKGRPICTCLWLSFGEDNSGIVQFMQEFAGREKALEIFMGNGAGRRKDNSGEGHFLPGIRAAKYSELLEKRNAQLFDKIDARLKPIVDFCRLIDDGLTQFLMCWELEDNLGDEAHQILDAWGRRIWPWKTVRCSSDRAGANFKEKHGSGAKGDSRVISNQDGDESFTKDEAKSFLERNQNAYAAILWDREAQGSGLPRRKRSFKISDRAIQVRGNLLSKY